jgi:hypothetical protein
MERPGTPQTVFEDDDNWTDDDNSSGDLVTPQTSSSPDSLLPLGSTDKAIIVSYEEIWKPGQVCAEIQVHSKDTYSEEILILDRSDRSYTVRPKARAKYVFVLVDGVIRLYVTHQEHNSAIAGDIGHSNITEDGGFILSGAIEISRQADRPRRIPHDEFEELNKTLLCISVLYCQLLTTPKFALTLSGSDFVRRQLSFCGLYLRTSSQCQRLMCIAPCFNLGVTFPAFGTLGSAEIKNEHIHVVVHWEDQGCRVCRVVEIHTDISELNQQGYYFLTQGIVPAGKIQTIPNRYEEIVMRTKELLGG